MNNITISIIGNQIFLEIIKELKLFSKFKIDFYNNSSLFKPNILNQDQLIIFFLTEENISNYEKLINYNFPLIVVTKVLEKKQIILGKFVELLNMPFKILDLEKKIISILAKYKFIKSSLINLSGYIIDKNERKIKKNNLELQLSEKEISFLILFSVTKKPISKNLVLKNVWNYSEETETHTVETHIHRLRKKILEKFGDNTFIKNNDKGYYI